MDHTEMSSLNSLQMVGHVLLPKSLLYFCGIQNSELFGHLKTQKILSKIL